MADPASPAPDRTRVLFVCLGNICRSPLAEGVFRHLAEEAGLADRFEVDSAGTGAYHVGESPDPRMRRVARGHGVELAGRARQLTAEDLERFDVVVAMDQDNLVRAEELGDGVRAPVRLHLLREFDPEAEEGDVEVPDPYFGGLDGFDRVWDMVERSCRRLLEELEEET